MLLIVFPAIVIATLAVTIYLGRLAENWFLAFGMVLVALASAVSVFQALRNSWAARVARKVDFEVYLPKEGNTKSQSFRYLGSLMGINVRNPIDQLAKDIKETRRQTDQDIQRLENLHLLNHHRINACLAQIKYHEDVTLPSMLGVGSGYIVAAAIFTIWGSLYLAFPNHVYEWAQHAAREIGRWLD